MLDGSVLWNESLFGPLGTLKVLNQRYLLLVAFSGNFSSTCGSVGCGSFRDNRVDPLNGWGQGSAVNTIWSER